LAGPQDTIYVWGDKQLPVCQPPGRTTYKENVFIPSLGLTLIGIYFPIVDGQNLGRAITFPDGERRVTTVTGFDIQNGKIQKKRSGHLRKGLRGNYLIQLHP
jgi:hypothetical protein